MAELYQSTAQRIGAMLKPHHYRMIESGHAGPRTVYQARLEVFLATGATLEGRCPDCFETWADCDCGKDYD